MKYNKKNPPGSTAMQPDGYGDCVTVTPIVYTNYGQLSRGKDIRSGGKPDVGIEAVLKTPVRLRIGHVMRRI